MRQIIFTTIFCLAFAGFARAQYSSMTQEDEKPLWIQLIDKSDPNYLEARKAFDTYWKGKELPLESENEGKDFEDIGFADADMKYNAEMVFYYKKFREWERRVLPFVDFNTGKILNTDEQLNIWKKNRAN